MTHLAKIICGAILCSLALVTATISCSLNVQHGLEISGAIAALYLLAELGRIFIPAVAARMGWNSGFKIIVVICGATSLFAATNSWLDKDATHLLSANTTNAKSDRAAAEYARINSELAVIKVSGTVADLEALASTYKAKADAEAKRGFCGKDCKKAEDNFAATMATLAQARDKARLETELAAAKADMDSTVKVVASGFAQVIASVTGLDQERIAMAVGVFKVILAIALLESMVYLGIPGFQLLIAGFCKEEDVIEDTSVVTFKPLEKREAETLERLVAMILRSEDGTIICSGRELARRLGVSNSTFTVWLNRWTKDGKITAEPVTAHKKRFAAA